MNVRKNTDYSAMFIDLEALLSGKLPQMKLYYEIGRLVSARPEKGAAVAAAEYLCGMYPDASGFSPRNLRRMREFYRTYEHTPETLAAAMAIGWTQNIVILENCETADERAWYISAVRRFRWSKAELLRKISEGKNDTPAQDNPHRKLSLDIADELCYTEKNATSKEISGDAAPQDSQLHGAGGIGPANGVPSLLLLCHPQLLHRGIYPQPLLVRRRCGRPLGVADGAGPPGRGGLRQALRQESWSGEPGMVSRSGKLPARWIRLGRTLRGRSGQPLLPSTASNTPMTNMAGPMAGALPAMR